MKRVAIIVARLIFAFAFAQAAAFKFLFVGIDATAAQIAAVGFPLPTLLAWLAAFFEIALAIAFLTGLFFREAALVAAAYVLFLGFVFYGPGKWSGDLMAYGMFINHLVFIAGLFFATVHGPGNTLVLRRKTWPTTS
jgi:putative oxidoreductase